jgi:hypothetical protein
MVLIAAGCASDNGRYAGLQECGYTFDYPVGPPSGLTPGEIGDAIPFKVDTGVQMTGDPSPFLVSLTEYP